VEGKIKGGVGRGMLKTTATKNPSGLLENNCYKTAQGLEEGPSHGKATTIYVSLHL